MASNENKEQIINLYHRWNLKVSLSLKNSRLIQTILDQRQRQIAIDLSENRFQSVDVTLICYKIHLLEENQDVFIYFFKNVNPISKWHDLKIRHGDRLTILNGEDTIQMTDENVYSIMTNETDPFTCQVIWHPELYIHLETSIQQNLNLNDEISINSNKTLLNPTIYNPLVRILRHHLAYHPKEPYTLVEEFSRRDFDYETDLKDRANRQLSILSNPLIIENNTEENLKNMLEVNIFFTQIGFGLNTDEIYRIWLSMKTLVIEKPSIQKLRFWGKIFGLKNNYYIVEADLNSFDDIDVNDSEFVKYQNDFTAEEEETNINSYEKIPPELVGEGVNEKVFFVTTGSDQPFEQLPLITPEQIELSRRIQQFFTGDLEASVLFEWNFPGVEKHLLRAQIQRISAGTQIAPKNYFRISVNDEDEEEDEEEMNGQNDKFEINDEFKGNTIDNLTLSNGEYWVHYAPYLYQQGRNVYYQQPDISDEVNGEKSLMKKIPIERQVHVLSPVNEDIPVDEFYPAWSIGVTSTFISEHTRVYVRSNRWPGAVTVGDRRHFENIYIGWGLKNSNESSQANMIDLLPKNEYKLEIIERNDPSVEEENELFKSSILLSPDEDEEFEDNIE